MKPIENFNPHEGGSFSKLPAGCYVARIINAVEDGRTLTIKVDIVEGEYKGYYTKNFEAQAQGNYAPKYKGYYRIFLQTGENAKSDAISKDKLEKAIFKVQASNPGYVWDWDERKLAGKMVGINVRNATYNGNSYTEIGCFESVADVRSGKARVMPDKKERQDGTTIEQANTSSDTEPKWTEPAAAPSMTENSTSTEPIELQGVPDDIPW